MFRKILAALSSLTLFSGAAFSQVSCDAEKVSALVDTYASNPFSARTWRVLNGLGDPMIEPSQNGSDSWDNQQKWKTLVAGILPSGQAAQDVGYECRVGYPLQVLQSRVATLGKENPYVRQWLRVQEKVLQVCSDPNTTNTALPDPIEVDGALAATQADDRAYQEATIAFYKDKLKAIELFRAIAATGSPHKAAARYNIANLRANLKDVGAARQEANAILADPALSSVHGITQELLGYIANLEDTPAGWTALIDDSVKAITAPTKDILASDKLKGDYARALNDIDYAGIHSKRDDWWLKGTLPADATISKAILDASRKHPMALWMMAGQTVQGAYDLAPWSLVGDKWNAWTTSYLDQVLAAVFDQAVRDRLDDKREALLKQHPMVKAVNWKEIRSLASMPGAPRLLAQSAIRWGKASKGDDGAPEALALAVRTTRYGCSWHGRHRAYSKPAQQLLQIKFSHSSWAKQTPYWFDCQRNEWDKDYNKVVVCDARAWPKQALPR